MWSSALEDISKIYYVDCHCICTIINQGRSKIHENSQIDCPMQYDTKIRKQKSFLLWLLLKFNFYLYKIEKKMLTFNARCGLAKGQHVPG